MDPDLLLTAVITAATIALGAWLKGSYDTKQVHLQERTKLYGPPFASLHALSAVLQGDKRLTEEDIDELIEKYGGEKLAVPEMLIYGSPTVTGMFSIYFGWLVHQITYHTPLSEKDKELVFKDIYMLGIAMRHSMGMRTPLWLVDAFNYRIYFGKRLGQITRHMDTCKAEKHTHTADHWEI